MADETVERKLRVKRVYDAASPDDGKRVLVDRLWPRGIAKQNAPWDAWMPAVSPSSDLRKWFSHNPERFEEFKRQYTEELTSVPEQMAQMQHLLQWLREGTVTLLYAAKDTVHNNAVVLHEVLTAGLYKDGLRHEDDLS